MNSKAFHNDNRLLIILTALAGIAVHFHYHIWIVTIVIVTLPLWAGILQIIINLVCGDNWNETMNY